MELTPEELRVELDWIAAHTNGRPFGLDLIVPNAAIGKDESISDADLVNMVPDGHIEFADSILESQGIDTSDLAADRNYDLTFTHNIQGQKTNAMLEVLPSIRSRSWSTHSVFHHPTCSSLLGAWH